MVKSVESVVVRHTDVGVVVQEEGKDVIPLLADGIVEGSVTFRILEDTKMMINSLTC